MNEEVFQAVGEALRCGESAALVTIIRTHGSTPQRVGAKMLVFADGRTIGTIGGGCYENDAFWKARKSIETSKHQVAKYELTDDIAEESGLVCGGQMEVYIEPLETPPNLYLVGGGHVAYHLAKLAATVGFRIHVIDDREKFANTERFPDAVEVVVDTCEDWLQQAAFPENAYVVILTRGHRHDLEALRVLAPRELRYLGLIGSRAKVARLYGELKKEAIPTNELSKIHAPVGLNIGAVTPQEIAVSILAELIAVKYGKIGNKTSETNKTVTSLRWAPAEFETSVITDK
jgi:xanthine dehydrogenase accessory factor